jgi:predicted nucleic acid-binding protein
MSGRNLLLDSNIVIYTAQQKLEPEAYIQSEDSLYISDITFMETLGYAFSDPVERTETEALLTILFRLPISESIVQKVIEIRQSRRMKLPDAIIAATALVHDCILVTRNISDFAGLSELTVLDPYTP